MTGAEELVLADLTLCFEGAIPAILSTASAEGVPNVTHLSRVQMVDAERVALSNQFFSKTARNLAENPRASLLLVDPTTCDEFRLALAYERTERRGPVFDRLRGDIDVLAALQGMQDVFKLRAADIYRVVDIERLKLRPARSSLPVARSEPDVAAVSELTARLGRCSDLDTLVGATVDGLAEVLGYGHSIIMLVDEGGRTLYTIASHGYEAEGVGSELDVGHGLAGTVAARCVAARIGGVKEIEKYSRTVRRSFEETGGLDPSEDIPVPGLAEAQSRIAVPAIALGQLVGVLVAESTERVAFGSADEAALGVVATVVAHAIVAGRAIDPVPAEAAPGPAGPFGPAVADPAAVRVRFFAANGSVFIDGDYLIKGVAGRVLWSLLGQHAAEGRVDFTHREVRLDPTLGLPGIRDNLDSRLLLLKRRLDERAAPVRIHKTGRGRFRIDVDAPLRLESVG